MLDARLETTLCECAFKESDALTILDIQGAIGGSAWDARTLLSWARMPDVEVRLLRERRRPEMAVAFFVVQDSLRRGSRSLYLANLGVASAWRRRGVGRFALRSIEEHARRRGSRRITLHVEESNLPAQCLYRAMGYVVVQIERAGYGCQDAYRMVRELP